MRGAALAAACEALRAAHPDTDPGAARVRQGAHRDARGGRLLTPKRAARSSRGLRQMEGEGIVEMRSKVGRRIAFRRAVPHTPARRGHGRAHAPWRAARAISARSAMNTTQRGSCCRSCARSTCCARVLIELARQHTDTILPGYSFGQQAQPMTLAHLCCRGPRRSRATSSGCTVATAREPEPAGAAIMVGSEFR